MALQKQTVAFPLVSGVDETDGDNLVAPPKLLAATNVMWNSRGQVQPRYGWANTTMTWANLQPNVNSGSGATIPRTAYRIFFAGGAIHAVVTYGDTTELEFPRRLFRYTGVPGAEWTETLSRAGPTHAVASVSQPISVFLSSVLGTATSLESVQSVAYVTGYIVYAYYATDPTNYAVHVSVQDETSGKFIYQHHKVTTNDANYITGIYMVKISSTKVLVGAVDNTNTFYYFTVTPSTITSSSFGVSAVTSVANVSTVADMSTAFDSSGDSNSRGAMLVYQDSSDLDIKYKLFDTSGTVSGSGTVVVLATSVVGLSVHCGEGTGGGYGTAVVYQVVGTATATIKYGTLTWSGSQYTAFTVGGTESISLVNSVAAETYSGVILVPGTNDFVVVHSAILSNDPIRLIVTYISTSGANTITYGQTGVSGVVYGVPQSYAFMSSRLEKLDANTALVLFKTGKYAETYSVLAIDLFDTENCGGVRELARIVPKQVLSTSIPSNYFNTIHTYVGGSVPPIAKKSSSVFYFTAQCAPDNATVLIRFDTSATEGYGAPVAANSDETLVPGGVPYVVGRQTAVEVGFPHGPTRISAADTSTAASGVHTTTSSTYAYAVIFTFVSVDGRTFRSEPIKVSSTNSGVTNKAVLITGEPLMYTTKGAYDSYGAIGTGTPVLAEIYRTTETGLDYFRVGVVNVPPGIARQWTYEDTTTDATLVTKPKLYTYGGVLQNEPPPSCRFAVNHLGRVWLIGCDRANQVWISKEPLPGESVSFNSDLVIECPEDVYAGASLGSQLVLFGRSRLYVVVGDPPDNTGAGATIRYAADMQLPYGLYNIASVGQTPAGVFFQCGGRDGSGYQLYLFDGRSIIHMGEYASLLTTTIKRTIYDGYRDCVYFIMASSMAVYNLRYKTWAKWTYPTNFTAIDAAYHPDENALYVLGTVSGVVTVMNWSDSSGGHDPNNATVNWTIRTGWLRTAGIAGFQRVWKARLLGTFNEATDLSIAEYTDNSTSPNQTVAYDYLDGTATAGTVVQPELYIKNQRCESISIEISTSSPESSHSTGTGLELAAIAFEFGVESGLNRGKASERH